MLRFTKLCCDWLKDELKVGNFNTRSSEYKKNVLGTRAGSQYAITVLKS